MAQIHGYERSEPFTIQNIKDEQYSMSRMEWKNYFFENTLDKVTKMLQEKRWYLEHCINYLQDDTINFEDGMCWIGSPNKRTIENLGESDIKDRIYLDKDSPIHLMNIFTDFYYCTLYREKLPNEIDILEETIAYLYSQM
jgi:hypothetical protein